MQSILVVQRVVRAAFSGIATLNGRRHLRSWRRQSATLLPTAGLSTTTQALEERTLLAAASPQFLDPNPSVQNGFGEDVLPLSTGNVVITAPWDDAAGEDAGAVYLFNGSTGELISTLLGASPFDHIGSGGVVGLENGNFVISSPDWKNGGIAYAGAVTFSNGLTGISGVVSAANSLVGETFGDNVGGTEVVALANGNYVVVSKGWSSGGSANVGAVTFGNGLQGVSGPVSAANSLVGTSPGDLVGLDSVVSLPNGNYVVVSSAWNSGAAPEVGAVTFGNGVTGISGPVSSANSLVGKRALDRVGEDGVTVLSNGNYVVSSTSWDNGSAVDAGASTFGRGTVGITGEVSASNSLVGTRSDDLVGAYRTIALPNGNYLVSSPFWDNGGAADAGAVTFCNGTLGLTGAVSALNSLVGSTSGDSIGETDRIVLANGNYVICSASWDNGAAVDAGAATYGSGTTGVTGVVSALNSLVG
ncbi:MAG: Bifunctional hemolysin/adenylate cyclase precursor, partial [Planctomycetota bacterium]